MDVDVRSYICIMLCRGLAPRQSTMGWLWGGFLLFLLAQHIAFCRTSQNTSPLHVATAFCSNIASHMYSTHLRTKHSNDGHQNRGNIFKTEQMDWCLIHYTPTPPLWGGYALCALHPVTMGWLWTMPLHPTTVGRLCTTPLHPITMGRQHCNLHRLTSSIQTLSSNTDTKSQQTNKKKQKSRFNHYVQ